MHNFQQPLLDENVEEDESRFAMHARFNNALRGHETGGLPADSREQFRMQFQRAMRGCLRRRFSLEEAFGVVFTETLHEVPLGAEEEAEMFGELLNWAKQHQKLFAGCSMELFTEFPERNG